MKVQIYTDHAGETRWRIRSDNGRTIADSGEGYTDVRDAIHGVQLVTGRALYLDSGTKIAGWEVEDLRDVQIRPEVPDEVVEPGPVRTWRHPRKGTIRGRVHPDDDGVSEWVHIVLSDEVLGVNDEWSAGETITVRRSFLTEVDQ